MKPEAQSHPQGYTIKKASPARVIHPDKPGRGLREDEPGQLADTDKEPGRQHASHELIE